MPRAPFDLVHDYPRRLTRDTLLRNAHTVGAVPPGVGVEAVCTAQQPGQPAVRRRRPSGPSPWTPVGWRR